MEYTNERRLPAHIARMIEKTDSKYSNGGADYSATGLIRPAHMAALEKRHAHELKTDVSAAIYRAWGTVAHELLADGHGDALQEVRFFADVDGKTLSGQVDVIVRDASGRVLIYDTKTTSAAAMQAGDGPATCVGTGEVYMVSADWIPQVNIYAWLAAHGHRANEDGDECPLIIEADELRVAVLLRDWSAARAVGYGYPHAPALDLILPKWTDAETLAYIRDRIDAHENPPDECTPAERWERGPSYRVAGPNAPDKNFRSVETAERGALAANKKGGEHHIEMRPGTSARCSEQYCAVFQFCRRGKGTE